MAGEGPRQRRAELSFPRGSTGASPARNAPPRCRAGPGWGGNPGHPRAALGVRRVPEPAQPRRGEPPGTSTALPGVSGDPRGRAGDPRAPLWAGDPGVAAGSWPCPSSLRCVVRSPVAGDQPTPPRGPGEPHPTRGGPPRVPWLKHPLSRVTGSRLSPAGFPRWPALCSPPGSGRWPQRAAFAPRYFWQTRGAGPPATLMCWRGAGVLVPFGCSEPWSPLGDLEESQGSRQRRGRLRTGVTLGGFGTVGLRYGAEPSGCSPRLRYGGHPWVGTSAPCWGAPVSTQKQVCRWRGTPGGVWGLWEQQAGLLGMCPDGTARGFPLCLMGCHGVPFDAGVFNPGMVESTCNLP